MSRLEVLGVHVGDSEYTVCGIEGATVTQMCFSYQVKILFQGHKDRMYELELSSAFQFFIDDRRQEVNPEDLNTCYSIFKLYSDIVTNSSILKSGELSMAFKSGAKLVTKADDNYESWNFGMSTNNEPEESWLLICMPGGDIAVFA